MPVGEKERCYDGFWSIDFFLLSLFALANLAEICILCDGDLLRSRRAKYLKLNPWIWLFIRGRLNWNSNHFNNIIKQKKTLSFPILATRNVFFFFNLKTQSPMKKKRNTMVFHETVWLNNKQYTDDDSESHPIILCLNTSINDHNKDSVISWTVTEVNEPIYTFLQRRKINVF